MREIQKSEMALYLSETSHRSQGLDLLEVAHQRLYPSLSNPNFLVLRSRRLIFQEWIKGLDRQTLTILDVGGRYQPYRPLFGSRVLRYVACDLTRTELVDVLATGESLPFAAETFDVVVCTQVFEYFSDPHLAAREIHEALKPNGALFMSVASFAPRFVHEEKWRYTPSGIRSVLSPFSEVTVVPETTSIGGLVRAVNLGLQSFAYYLVLRKLLGMTICRCLNVAGLALENMNLTSNDQFTPNYSVLAIK